MHGELNKQYKIEAHEQAITAPIIQEDPENIAKKLRDKGLI